MAAEIVQISVAPTRGDRRSEAVPGARPRPRAARGGSGLAWWRIHRLAVPNLLRDEMHSAKKPLSEFPEGGKFDETKGGEIRRLPLRAR